MIAETPNIQDERAEYIPVDRTKRKQQAFGTSEKSMIRNVYFIFGREKTAGEPLMLEISQLEQQQQCRDMYQPVEKEVRHKRVVDSLANKDRKPCTGSVQQYIDTFLN